MLKKKVSLLLSFVLVLTLALSFSFPSCAGTVGSSSAQVSLYGPTFSLGSSDPDQLEQYSSFSSPFTVSYALPISTWNGGTGYYVGANDVLYFSGSLRISPYAFYVYNSDSVFTVSQTQISRIYFVRNGQQLDVPFTTVKSHTTFTCYYGLSFYVPDMSIGDTIWNDDIVLFLEGTFTAVSSSSTSSSIAFYDQICPRVDVTFSQDKGAIWLSTYYVDSVSGTDLNNQTNSINNAISNQTTSINNNINQATQNQTNTLTGGYDNSGMENTNKQLADSLASYDQTESQVTDQSVAYIDAVSFFDPTTHLQLMTSITYVSTFLQSLFVSLGDWSVLVMISLSLAFALMLIGWFKYRK